MIYWFIDPDPPPEADRFTFDGCVLPAQSSHCFLFPVSLSLSFPTFAHLMNRKCGVPAMRLVAAAAEGLNH